MTVTEFVQELLRLLEDAFLSETLWRVASAFGGQFYFSNCSLVPLNMSLEEGSCLRQLLCRWFIYFRGFFFEVQGACLLSGNTCKIKCLSQVLLVPGLTDTSCEAWWISNEGKHPQNHPCVFLNILPDCRRKGIFGKILCIPFPVKFVKATVLL